ncbi:nicotinate-nucleotide--dimethylbenzimidazole phosphoribosyltransferase, partial [Aeromicrobium sp. REDSEA-S32_B7]
MTVEPVSTPSAVRPPDPAIHAAARERLAGLATPPGALGRLGDLACWVAATQGEVPPRPVDQVRAVVLAGDHGVTASGVSAFPSAVTPAMVRTFAAGRAGASVLAAQHGVSLRVLDLGVDDDLADLPDAVRAHKVRRGSGAIDVEDALSADETARALAAGRAIAAEEIAAGAQLLVTGDMGIGNTTPTAALVAASLGLPGSEVVGRGTGIDDASLVRKGEVVQAALDRAG